MPLEASLGHFFSFLFVTNEKTKKVMINDTTSFVTPHDFSVFQISLKKRIKTKWVN